MAALFGAALVFLLFAPFDRALAARPNFVVIQTDDQNAATVRAKMRGQVGGFQRVMPHSLRQIVRKGTEFRNYYASSPVCSPSRASLLSGQYPWNHGIEGNRGSSGGWTGWLNHPIYRQNLASAMQGAGYVTTHIGKFTNGYYDTARGDVETRLPGGWDNWFTTSYVRGTHFYGYRLNVNGTATNTIGSLGYGQNGPGIDPPSCAMADPANYWPNGPCTYSGDVFTAAAVRQIRRSEGQPFFIQLDYQAPHGDVAGARGPQPATRSLGSASATKLPRPASFNELDFSDKPPLIRAHAPNQMNKAEIDRLATSYRSYLESLHSVDDGVGAILRSLRKTGQLQNTYVFLLSDHGLFLGEHRFDWGKFLPYEDSSSPFMAVRGPGVTRAAVSREVTGNIDVPATIMKIAGASPSYPVDGRSLKPFWQQPGLRTNRPMAITINSGHVSDHASVSARAPALRYRGFRVGPYKYIRYGRGGEELYDLSIDPDELKNRIDSRRYGKVADWMRSHLGEVTRCSGAACRSELPAPPKV